jgi:hypothetical protein
MRRLWRRPRLGACGDCGLRGLSTVVGCGCAATAVAAGALTTAVTPVAAAARGMLPSNWRLRRNSFALAV